MADDVASDHNSGSTTSSAVRPDNLAVCDQPSTPLSTPFSPDTKCQEMATPGTDKKKVVLPSPTDKVIVQLRPAGKFRCVVDMEKSVL